MVSAKPQFFPNVTIKNHLLRVILLVANGFGIVNLNLLQDAGGFGIKKKNLDLQFYLNYFL